MEFFSLRNNDKKITPNNKDSLNTKELISKLDILFEEQLSKTFKDIMILQRNNFLNIIISEVKNFLDEQYGEEIYKNEKFINFFSSSCNNLEDKYNTYLDELSKAWEEYQLNKKSKNENSYFFSNFRKHCLNTDNYAMHNCSDGKYGYYIQVIKKTKKGTINPKKKSIQNCQIQYLICNRCKAVYFNNKFINYCKRCNINYLCSNLSYNEDPDLLLATLENPHCETLVNEKIKCNKCKDNSLYLNMKLNKLQCHNKSCTYNVIPYNIEWTCNICNKIFHSNVKVYNPIEIQEIKDIINTTLLLKKRAHPTKVSCCKNINVLTEDFFHKKECKGLLYFGEYNSKTIIVCDKCKAINFLFKFIWTCPKCGTRFKDRGSLTNEEKTKNFVSPNHGNKRKYNHKINILNENDNENHDENYKNNVKYNKEFRNSNNISRKNKETLSSILKRKSAKNINELENTNNTNNNNNSENVSNLNNSLTKNNNSKNEINNIDNKEINKNPKNKRKAGNSIEKSLSESKINKTFKKKNSILDKQMIGGNIEPIKEETETKLNSPSIQKLNISDAKIEKINMQDPLSIINSRKNKTRNVKNANNKENNYNQQINNNIIFNNYIKYVSISSNIKKKDDKENKDNKIFISYSKKLNEDDNNKNEEENTKNEDKNNIFSKRSYVGSCKHRTRIIINREKEKIFNNNNETNNNINDIKKEREKEIKKEFNKNGEIQNNTNYLSNIKTDEISNNIRNTNTHMISYYKTNKNDNTPTTVITSKYLFYKNKKGFLSQDNISDHNSSQDEDKSKNKYKRRNKNRENKENKENNTNNTNNENKENYEYKENKENTNFFSEKNISKCETIKKPQNNKDALFNIIKFKKNLGYQDNIENTKQNNDLEKTEKKTTIRYRSRYKNKVNNMELENELNKSRDEIPNCNKNKYENRTNITKNRDIIKERLKNLRENIFEGENIKEKKTVRSRKETLKIREREKFLQNEKEKEKEININGGVNLNLNEKKDNKNKYYAFESRQESYKTKENTISRYTKDSEISLDKNKHWGNRFSGEHYNIKRYKERNKNNNNYNEDKNNQEDNDNNIEYNTEVKAQYHTKKSRKDYMKIKSKNQENNTKENKNKEIKTEKKVYKTSKKNLIISSYNSNFKNKNVNKNDLNKFEINKNDLDINLDDEEDIPIFDKEIRKDKEKYNQLQRKLKLILVKSSLPKFNIDYYVIKNQVGIGSFGVIFQVYHIKTRCKFALKKIIAPDIPTLQQFEKEFELVHQNPHPNILDLIGVCIQCVDLTNFVFYVLMDLAEEDWDTAINNRNKLKKYYAEFELIAILKQLVSALYFLQKEKKIAHRDIKPENILIFKNDIYKIGDFGEAKESKSPKQLSTLRGTELYMSPLLYNGLHDNKEDVRHNPFKSDVFSLGYCFIYAASLNLNIIYKIRNVNSIISLKQILMKEFNGRYTEKFVDLILKMIAFNEDKRVDFIELERILREEF